MSCVEPVQEAAASLFPVLRSMFSSDHPSAAAELPVLAELLDSGWSSDEY